ncbi:MAG: electron transfer flavoprotein subunit beta/FixA family protein [Actinomycetes bacterium]
MRIAVCVKQVPDSWAEKKMAGGVLDRAGVDAVLNDLDEYAIEEALRIVEANEGSSITLISMGPDRASDALRKGLSMGADEAILVADDALAASDALATSRVLAKIIESQGFDLVLCGTESTDARMSVIPAMLAERLDWAHLTFAGSLSVNSADQTVAIVRSTESGEENMTAALPAIVSVIEKINEPRYPSFKGIMAAKKKTISVLTLADVGIASDLVGHAGAWSCVIDATTKAARSAGVKIVDDGNAGNQLADYLAEKRLI